MKSHHGTMKGQKSEQYKLMESHGLYLLTFAENWKSAIQEWFPNGWKAMS